MISLPKIILNSNLARSRLPIIQKHTCPTVLRYYTEHCSDIAVLCAKFQNDWATGDDFVDTRDFARFEFKMNFEGYLIR